VANTGSALRYWLILLVLGFSWGTTIPLTKIVVSSGHQPIGLIFWQFAFISLVLGAIVFWRRIPIIINRQTFLFFLIISLTGTLVPNSFSYLAAIHLPAGVLGIIIASVPMFSLMIALTIGLERLALARVGGVALGLVAIIILIAPETSLPDPQKASYVLVALIAPFCYGIETNYLATKTPENTDAVTTLFASSVLGIFLAAPLAWYSGQWIDLTQSWDTPEWSLLASSIIHAIVYSSYIWLVGAAGPVFSSQIAYIVTIASVFLSALFLGEAHSNWVWLALAVMIAGIAMVRPREA